MEENRVSPVSISLPRHLYLGLVEIDCHVTSVIERCFHVNLLPIVDLSRLTLRCYSRNPRSPPGFKQAETSCTLETCR